MRDTEPTNADAEQQDPESSAAADAPEPETGDEGDEPATDKLHEDPAYEPGESDLKDLKGG